MNKIDANGCFNPFAKRHLSMLAGERMLQFLAGHGELTFEQLQQKGNFSERQLETALNNRAERINKVDNCFSLRPA